MIDEQDFKRLVSMIIRDDNYTSGEEEKNVELILKLAKLLKQNTRR